MWQVLQNASLDATEVQKLLMTCFLPRSWPSGLRYSPFQCSVLCICLAASVWQLRQALVTSGPESNSCCSALNLVWSEVDFSKCSVAGSDAACAAGARSMAAIRAAMNIPVRIVLLSFCKEAPMRAVV